MAEHTTTHVFNIIGMLLGLTGIVLLNIQLLMIGFVILFFNAKVKIRK